MPLDDIPFGSLKSREAAERVPLSFAREALNCLLDEDTLKGRAGYRAATASGIGSGGTQGIWRFRPDYNHARTIVVRGGTVYNVQDPSSETVSDGVISSGDAVFSSTARISGIQVGKYLYLGSDQSTDTWQRVKPDFTLEAFQALPKPGTIAAGPIAPNYILFTGLTAAPVTTGTAAVTAVGVADWRQLSGAIGDSVTYTFDAEIDASGDKWLFVSCSPQTQSTGDGSFKIELATNTGSFEVVASAVYDTPGDDSPYAIYCSLTGLTDDTRGHVRRLRFTQINSTSNYFVSGFCFVASAPGPGQVGYFVTFKDSASGQESVLSEPLMVSYSSDTIRFPQFQAARTHNGTLITIGVVSMNPDTFDNASLFNKGGGIASPQASELASVYVFTNQTTMPAGTYDTARLYRVTPSGVRFVKEGPATPGAAPGFGYSLKDDTGDSTNSHALYIPGGTPPPCQAIGALGGRILCGGDPSFPNRLSVSTYLAFGQDSDPFPQFPAVPAATTDGWTVDISPTPAEQIVWIGEGDKTVYVGTTEAMYGLNDLSAPLAGPPPFFQILERGPIGRRAAIWAEDRLFWASYDGIYTCQNRAFWAEMSEQVRAIYNGWLLPDSSTVLGYKNRKLWAITGTRALRFDFVTNTWTRHILTHTMQHMAAWRDPLGTIPQLWFLDAGGFPDRFQEDAPSDRGVDIPSWTYTTGFDIVGAKTRLNYLFADVSSGTVTISAFKDAATTGPPTISWTTSLEHEYRVSPYKESAAGNDATGHKWCLSLTGENQVTVRRLMWERTMVNSRGL